MLLDTAHDLLVSMVESSGQHNWEPNGSHTLKNVELIETVLDVIQI